MSFLALRLAAVALVCLVLIEAPALGSGYAIREQSTAAQGNAFAGATAGAEDISYMFFNPAGLTRHSGNQLLSTAAYIRPFANFDGTAGGANNALGAPNSGREGGFDNGPDAVVPSLYGLWSLSPDLKIGLAINVPFGLKTTYESGWVGRYHALDSELEAININPVVAYRFGESVSLGAGLQISRAQAHLTSAIDFGLIDSALFGGAFGGVPGASDGQAEVNGDDWGFGFNLGMMVEISPKTRVAAAYRSHITHNLAGDAKFTLGGPVGAGISAFTGGFVPTDASAELILPETISFGVHHAIDRRWSVMAEAAWTNWSRVEEVRVKFDNPRQDDSVTTMDWQDSWFLALGTSFQPFEDTTLRFGLAYEESPVTTRTRTAVVPDATRYWVSAGLGYEVMENLHLDFSYTHIFLAGADIRQSLADPNNLFRGNLSGDYDNAIDIFSLQVRYRF